MSQITGGMDLGRLFSSASSDLNRDSTALQKRIEQISAKGEINQTELLQLQWAMGQYNAKLETLSSVTKSIQDMLKSLAQRTG